jgi:hypothetical protein
MKIVATLTTLPDRYENLTRTIEYLLEQTHPLDAIYISLPKISKKGKSYPQLPEKLTKHRKIKVVEIEKDYGPITKILAPVKVFARDEEIFFISFDDDCYYPKTLVEEYVRFIKKYPEKFNQAVITGSAIFVNNSMILANMYSPGFFYKKLGVTIPVEGRYTDILIGSSGVLYKRSFFGHYQDVVNEFDCHITKSHHVFRNDDALISAYLKKHNVRILVIPNDLQGEMLYNPGEQISKDMSYFLYSLEKALVYLKENYHNPLDSTMDITEPLAYIIIFNLLMIVLLVVLCIYLYQYIS